MFKYFIFLCLAVSFCAYAHEERFDGRIIGGHPVEITEYPHQVSLQKNGEHICGGSIIGNGSFILTAAYCVRSQHPKNLKIRVGSSYHNAGGQLIAVQKFEADDYIDTAVLRLEKNIITGATAQPIELNSNKINELIEQSATVSGWGLTKKNGNDISEQLQAVSVNIFSQSHCIKAYEARISNRVFCAGAVVGGKDSCQGDSGDPLAVNGVLYGFLSWGKGCVHNKFPGVYVNVAKVEPWIKIAMLKLANSNDQ